MGQSSRLGESMLGKVAVLGLGPWILFSLTPELCTDDHGDPHRIDITVAYMSWE